MNYSYWYNKKTISKHKYDKISSSNSILTKKTNIQQTNIQDLYKKKKWDQLIKVAKQTKDLYEEYDKIRIGGNDIQKGESVLINSGYEHDNDYIGTIKQIISIKEPQTSKIICLCRVNWMMRKSEIVKLHPKTSEWISEQELFSTLHEEYILAQSIIEKCKILECNEYVELEEIDSNIYYARLNWDMVRKQIYGYEKVHLYCQCKQPVNPDRKYIQCDECEEWYHLECVNMEEINCDEKEFICKSCQ